MRVFKAIIVTLIVGGLIFLSISCTGTSGATVAPKTQIATVQKGNISIQVTGTGNLALETKLALSFGQTGQVNNATTAKISEVDVMAGQIVEKGQVLVKADPQDWQDTITADQHALDSAKAGLDSAKAGLDSAKASLDSAKANVIQAQANLQSAQYNLSMQKDIQTIQDNIDNTNAQFQQAKLMLQQATAQNDAGSMSYWRQMINYYSVSPLYKDINGKPMTDGGLMGQYEKQMADLLADPAHSGAATSVADITSKQFAVQQAQASLVNSQNGITTAQNGITNAQNNIITAQNKVDDAQTALNNDKASLQEIDAPFKGLITKLWTNTNGNTLSPGDIVARNTTLIEIADPEKFVANILVTERDVMSVNLGGDATVSFDALSGLNFPAKITQIAPLSTTSQGVVNYKVTVELTSTRPVFSTSGTTGSSLSANGATPSAGGTTPRTIPSGTPSAGRTPGVIPSRTPGATGTLPSRPPGSASGSATQAVNLKDGLSATVNILVQEKDNILMVPSRAISRQGRNSTVQKINGTTTETVTVQTGITDSTNTEIVSGLNEGDQVLIQSITATPRSGGLPGGGIRLP